MFGLLIVIVWLDYSDHGDIRSIDIKGVIMFWALPLGFSQYFGLFLELIIHSKVSKYNWHLGLSTLVLLNLDDVIPIKELNTLAWYSCGTLAIYYWILTFRNTNYEEKEHSVYDL
jgi:hypothetical protein